MMHMVKIMTFFAFVCLVCCSSSGGSNFVNITTFQTTPSDQFLVDLTLVDRATSFVGSNNASPHNGAHVHYVNGGLYPSGSNPTVYPAIYAVADGTISDVESYRQVGDNYKYDILLQFATSNGNVVDFEYSIEPFINPNNSSAYESYILVSAGQVVSKGDVIAYMFIPEETDGTHIHFNLTSGGSHQSPAIFTSEIKAAFVAKIQDGSTCMSIDLIASENPFGTGETSCL